jgi:hypothetical protein
MKKNSNVRYIPKPLLAQVDALIQSYRVQQAEAQLKELLSTKKEAA